MATVNKDFRIKSGLIVEGANATVNGEDIITTGSSTDNLQEGTTNLYFTDQRAIDAVGGSATDANTPNTVVKRDGSGNFAAGTIGANEVTIQNAGHIFEDSSLIIESSAGYPIDIAANQNVTITSANGDIVLNADGNVYKGSATSGNELATTGRLDYLIGDNTVNGSTGNTVADRITTAENSAKSYADSLATNYDAAGAAAAAQTAAEGYTDTAIANLVDGAPALLDTLNELAAAIADNPNYATDVANLVAGKQDTLTAGTNINITGTTISVTGLDSADISDFSTAALSATASAYDAAGAAATAEQNAKNYADGLASGYEVSGAAATAEANANAYTDTKIASGDSSASPQYQAINLGYYRKEEGTWTAISANQTGTVHSFNSSWGSAKYLVRVYSNGHSQTSEVLVIRDSNNNVALTEYGIVYTSESELATITATHDGTNTNLRVTATNGTNGIEVMTAATLLAYWD